MNDEPTNLGGPAINLGGPAIGAINATSLPAVVDRATLQTKLGTACGVRKRRTPAKATRSPQPGAAYPSGYGTAKGGVERLPMFR